MIVELLEALMLVVELLRVGAGEELVLGAKIINELSGEVDGGWLLALVLLLGLSEEGRDVLLDQRELHFRQWIGHEVRGGLVFNHI